MKAVVIDLVPLGPVDCRENLSPAVKALHAWYLYPVYQAGRKPRAKPIINIYDCYTGGTRIEHAEKRRKPPEARPVTDASRHGDHRLVGQSGYDTRQRPFHPSYHDQNR